MSLSQNIITAVSVYFKKKIFLIEKYYITSMTFLYPEIPGGKQVRFPYLPPLHVREERED
jgi:hypothetical protein